MKTISASYCKRCIFYHGNNQVVCGIHPYGPDSKTCSDYVPQVNKLEQGQTRRSWSISQFHDYKGWKKLLMLGLLLATKVIYLFLAQLMLSR